jgi:hypothetical protein
MNEDLTYEFYFPAQFFSTNHIHGKQKRKSTQQSNCVLPPPTYKCIRRTMNRFILVLCLVTGKFQYWKVEGDDKDNYVACAEPFHFKFFLNLTLLKFFHSATPCDCLPPWAVKIVS